jgi:UDP-N-acetylmuramyl pentapeptide phosphotransferase/UDP-N-acetylglucosamine-1-phosphate transferase
MHYSEPILSLLVVLLAALMSSVLIYLLHPLLVRYALARPNARSAHRIPTPQGAGLAVIIATLVGSAATCAILINLVIPPLVLGATVFIAFVGFADDIKSVPVLPRLIMQAAAVGAVIFTAPADMRIVAECPLVLERGLLFLAGLWFVNLVNFMDGLDLMTVSEVVPITAAMILLGWFGLFPKSASIVAAALCGAMLGFAPFNRPVAKVFLGDVGSLPIGLLLGWCLLQLCWEHQFVAALLFPLYYVADSTLTLLGRIANREPFWAAHRSHFYQRATDNGFAVLRVVREVFVLNIVLASLAIISTTTASTLARGLTLVGGMLAVSLVLHRFSRVPKS